MLQSEEFFSRLAEFNLNWATFLLELGNALGEHAFYNCPDGHVLLPGDSPDFGYEVLVTDTREMPCFVSGRAVGIVIALPLATTLVNSLLRCI